MRSISSTDRQEPGALGPGILLETRESFPMAFCSTKHLKKRRCIIHRADFSEFGTVEATPGLHAAHLRSPEPYNTLLASVFATQAHTMNVVDPDGTLMATMQPNDPSTFHPLATEPEFV